MDDPDLYIDDLTDTSESESSEPSLPSSEEGPFKTNTPFVLELHDIRKDDPSPPPVPTHTDPLIGAAAAKVKRHKKKKKASDAAAAAAKERRASLSTDSMSDASSVAPSATNVKEEFYDARESYHVIPENEVPAIAEHLEIEPETILEPKAPGQESSTQQQSSSQPAHKESSAIVKPTSPP